MYHILLAGDINVLPYMTVVMQSVVQNLKSKTLFHIMYPEHDIEALKLLNEIKEEFFIETHPMTDSMVENLSNVAGRRWPSAAFYPLFLNQVLQIMDSDRVLVLDSDVLVVDSIDDLFQMPFDGKAILATSSWITGDAESYVPKGTNSDFNSGMYVVNLKRWNELNVNIDFWLKAQKRLKDKKKTLFDQDLLNEAFSVNDTKYINKSYNVNPHKYSLAKKSNGFEGRKIFHFTNNNGYFIGKPWDMNINMSDVSDAQFSYYYRIDRTIAEMVSTWWNIARGTIFYDKIYHDAEIRKSFYFKRSIEHFKKESLSKSSAAEWENIYYSQVKYTNKRESTYSYSKDNNFPTLYNHEVIFKKINSDGVTFSKVRLNGNYIVIPLPMELNQGDKFQVRLTVKGDRNFNIDIYLRENHANKQFIENIQLNSTFQTFVLNVSLERKHLKDLAIMWTNETGEKLSIKNILIKPI